MVQAYAQAIVDRKLCEHSMNEWKGLGVIVDARQQEANEAPGIHCVDKTAAKLWVSNQPPCLHGSANCVNAKPHYQ